MTIRQHESFAAGKSANGHENGKATSDINQKASDIIIMLLREKGKITNQKVREEVCLSAPRVRAILCELCDKDIIVPHGKNKGRYYTMK